MILKYIVLNINKINFSLYIYPLRDFNFRDITSIIEREVFITFKVTFSVLKTRRHCLKCLPNFVKC